MEDMHEICNCRATPLRNVDLDDARRIRAESLAHDGKSVREGPRVGSIGDIYVMSVDGEAVLRRIITSH